MSDQIPRSPDRPSDGVYSSVSFKLFDANGVDKVVLNGTVKDVANSKWSDLNGVEPGRFGAVLGDNTLEVVDIAGNVTTVEFSLVQPELEASIPETDAGDKGFRPGARITAEPGDWTPVPAFSYLWLADGQPIPGATSPQLSLKGKWNGKDITVQVTGTLQGYQPTTREPERIRIAQARRTSSAARDALTMI